jgi:hypothetical protein
MTYVVRLDELQTILTDDNSALVRPAADDLINISQRVHRYRNEKEVPHIWNVDDCGHDRASWGSNLYHFAQRLFQ